jgi:hypothetical protein
MDNFILAANNKKDNWKQFYTFFCDKKKTTVIKHWNCIVEIMKGEIHVQRIGIDHERNLLQSHSVIDNTT